MKMRLKVIGMIMVAVMGSGCGVAKHMAGTDQCMAPTAREARITKNVWK